MVTVRGSLTLADALAQLLEKRLGVGDEGVQMITFAAGYTFPAVVAFLIGTLLLLRTNLEFKTDGYTIVMGIGLLFVASAFACDRLGLGIPVTVEINGLEFGAPCFFGSSGRARIYQFLRMGFVCHCSRSRDSERLANQQLVQLA